ncbi:MAG: 50S ribosomal protein L17 [Deltaproteobacteria bacterium]|nr:50S ribosomal protein L17 [Deltaproteobacteria bacterium]
MRHLRSGRKFSRTASHRRALFANLTNALIAHEAITTTEAKAKSLRGYAEKLITMGKRARKVDLAKKGAMKRVAYSRLRDRGAVEQIFGPLAERYASRNGGYTRIYKLGPRNGDNAPMAIIELVDRPVRAEPVAAPQTPES